MAKTQDIDNLDREIRDSQIRADTARVHLATAQRTLDELVELEKQIEDNIKYLKRHKIAVVASEFKKAKEDLFRVKGKLCIIKAERDCQKRVLRENEAFVKESQEKLAKMLKGENNVILGKFRGKNG